jgi:hypothetical protein
MYGDSGVMRRRAAQIREQGADIRTMADQLVAQTEGIAWTGRAADAMRERIRERAAHLRQVASAHDTAADSLVHHCQQVDRLKDQIVDTERKAETLTGDARARVDQIESADDPAGVRRTPSPEDQTLAAFTPPPPGHKDWLTVTLPGL